MEFNAVLFFISLSTLINIDIHIAQSFSQKTSCQFVCLVVILCQYVLKTQLFLNNEQISRRIRSNG